MKLLSAAAIALPILAGCRPQTVVGPDSADQSSTAIKIAGTLSESGVSCEVTKEGFVHCNLEGTDAVILVSLAATGRQLTLMVPMPQPACSIPAFHARIAKFNSEFILVSAACVDAKTLILSHRSHLFRPGLHRSDLEDIVRKWFPTAVGIAAAEGLLGPVSMSPSAPPPPTKDKEPPPSSAGKI